VDVGIPGYEQPEPIGEGGYSVVYRAWQPAFQRFVAIKVISGRRDARALDRFERECAAIGALSGHPNIVTVHESGRTAGQEPYIVMELLSGSLAQQMEGQRLSWSAVVPIGMKLAGALESAHRAGVLHRDVKPENVLVSRYGEIKLGDFGIARIDGFNETGTGVVTASVVHAAPEVLEGRRPSVASDVYSLASTLYALLAGRAAFAPEPDEPILSLYRRVSSEPPPALPADVPRALGQLLGRGMAKNASERPATAAELGEQLRSIARELGLEAPPLPLAGPATIATALTKAGEEATRDAPDPARAATQPDLAPPRPGPELAVAGRRARPSPRALAVGALAALVAVAVIVGIILASSSGSKDNASSSTTVGDSTTARAAEPTTAPPTTVTSAPGLNTSPAPPTTAAAGVRLGVDLQPVTTEPCRTPTIANGAAWQLGAVQLSGRSFSSAYYCNLFAGAIGSLDFVLGGAYRVLRTTIGFSDRSSATNHVVRFEFVGDGVINLIDPITVRFGQVQDLNLDVSGITRLRIKITEVSPPGGSEAASQPALGSPTLIRT
jgi:serine/threonine protein kinase